MKKKYKTILIISAIAVVVIVAVIAWVKLAEPEGKPAGPTTQPSLPENAEEETKEKEGDGFSLTRLSDEEIEVFAFWENSGNGEVYYISTRGVVRSAKPGPDPEISTRSFSAINEVRPDDEGGRVLISFGDPKNPDWGMFDSKDGVWRPLPSYIKDIIWGEGEDEVVVIARTEKGKSLVSFDIEELQNGENEVSEVLIDNFTLKDIEISFSSPNSVIIIEKPASFYGSRVWKFDVDDKELVQIMGPIKGLVMDWKKEGIVFEYESEDNWFSILDKNLNDILPVIFTTLPSKCGTDGEKIYCFVPYTSFSDLDNIKPPEDYFKNKFYTSDLFYKIDIESGELEKQINITDFKMNIDGLKPEKIGKGIYFINKYDKVLYRLIVEE